MIGIDGQCVITITQAHSRPSTLSVWKLGRRSTLIHSWSKNFDELIDKNRQVRQNSFCVDYIFSNTMSTVTVEEGKQILFLLSDATVLLLDIQSKKCIMQENLKVLFKIDENQQQQQQNQPILNITQHPTYGLKHVIFAVGCKCYVMNCFYHKLKTSSSSNIYKNDKMFDPVIEILDKDIGNINHVSFSRNGKYLSCCTGPTSGKVFLYSVQQSNNGSLAYNLLYKLPIVMAPTDLNHSQVLHALASDFSWTSEELVVSYSSSELRVWQLPRFMSLKEITRNAISTIVPEERIHELQLPKELKNYLHFFIN